MTLPSRLVVSRTGFAIGCLLVVVGVFLLFGLGWALVASGVLLAASCLVLVDIDEDRREVL